MRASILLVVIVGLFACGQAIDLKEIGTSLVNTVVQKGKDLLADLAQNLLGKLAGLLGKRDLGHITNFLHDITSKLSDLFGRGKQLAQTAFGKAIDKLKAISDKFHAGVGLLKDDVKDVKDKVDDVVAEHHVLHKRIIADLIQKGKDLLGAAWEKVKGLASSLKAKASEIVSSLIQSGANVLVGKRTTLTEHLQNIGSVIGSVVSPFKDIVAGLGNTLKGHFSNLVDTVKGHYNALKDKLAGHVGDLKTHGKTLLDHGKNALGALSEVVSDILKQTLGNAKPALDGVAGALAGAGKTVLDHLSGADKAPATL